MAFGRTAVALSSPAGFRSRQRSAPPMCPEELDSGTSVGSLADLQDLLITRHPHGPYLERIWDFRNQFTIYDAVYLALTEALGATLLTMDRGLA